jgi:hypothetical protein
MKWRKRQQQTSTETKETYPPSEEQYNPNSNPVTPHEVQNGENHEMQNQTRPQGEAAEYYDNTAGHQAQTWQPVPGVNVTQGAYGQEGQQPQQQPQQQSQQQPQEDNKKKAMELAKKGWQMYKEHKNKPAA